MRQKGWKVYFTPFAEGVHEEHASSKLLTNLNQNHRNVSQPILTKWGTYFQENPRPPTFEAFEAGVPNPDH
jgi:hypothetical protein